MKPVVRHERDCPLESWGDATRDRVAWRTLLSADRTPTGALTLGIAELPAGDHEPVSHRHAQIEAYYVLEGEGLVLIEGDQYPVRAGSVVFIPGNAEHGAVNTGSETLRLLYVFATDSFHEVEYRFSTPGSRA